jgi:hypothetical protein
LDAPPVEIIEIAAAKDRNSALDALQSAADGADQQAAGRWLLAELLSQLTAGDISPVDAVRVRVFVTLVRADGLKPLSLLRG